MPSKPASSDDNQRQPTRIFKNFGLLLSGRLGAAVCTVVAMSIMARVLGVEQFGLVILVHTYIFVMNGLINTKSFEAVVRFGLQANLRGDQNGLENLLNSGYLFDFILAVLGFFLTIWLAPVVAGLINAEGDFVNWARGYAVVMFFTLTSTSNGVLRLYDRFATLGMQLAVGPFSRLLLVILAWQMGWGELGFLFAWAFGYLFENLILHYQGWSEVSRQGLSLRPWRAKPAQLGEQFESFWSFLGVTYIQSAMDLLPKQIATLLSGMFLGASGAGLFRVAREVATVVSRPALLLRQAVFTDLSRLWEQRDPAFAKITIKTALVSGLAGLFLAALMWPFGDDLLGAFFGQEYVSAHWLMVALLVAASFELTASSFQMAAYAIGKAVSIVLINLVATAVFILIFAGLSSQLGLMAAGIAALLMSLITLLGGIVLFLRRPA